MARIVNIDIEHLPEGVYLATSDDVQGLVAQADTLDELVKIVPDLIQMLEEVRTEHGWARSDDVPVVTNFRYSMLLAA